MTNLIKRTITGLLFSVTLLLAFFFSEYSMMGIVVVIAVLSLLEYFNIIKRLKIKPLSIAGIIVTVYALIITFLYIKGIITVDLLIIAIPLVFLLFILSMFSKTELPFEDVSATVFSLLHVVVPLVLLIFLCFITGEYEYRIITGIFLLIWTNDVFAYLIGISIGKHKLFPRISPKKSWEGFFGGLLFCCGASQIIATQWIIISHIEWLILSIIVAIAGPLGDLFESLIKRQADVKDSGVLLPGHGGILDRFDSLFMVMPFAFPYIYYVIK